MRILSGPGAQWSLHIDAQPDEPAACHELESTAPRGEGDNVLPNREFNDLLLRFLSNVAAFDARVDLSAVSSKYIGETEKSLDAVFRSAERSDTVLLVDEADSLFGRRSDVKDSHDR